MKNKLIAIIMSGAVLASGAVFAECDPKFYIGAEGQVNKYRGTKKLTTTKGAEVWRNDNKAIFGNSGSGASLFAGSRFTDNVGVEVGATALSSTKLVFKNDPRLSNSSLRAKTNNLYADLIGYLPVSQDMDLIGSVGVGRLASKVRGQLESRGFWSNRVNYSENVSLKSSKAGARFGAGIGYNIDKNLSARLMVRHQQGNKFIKSVTSAGVGLLFNF